LGSCFTDQPTAQNFAQQLANCVAQYGLDGIDIDFECTLNQPD
jgi:chitinase